MALKPMKTINFGGEDTFFLKPDFENIDNSPFETVGGDTLTWDGDTEGLEACDYFGDGSAMYYHISDDTPTLDSFTGGVTATMVNGSETESFELTDIGELGTDILISATNQMFVVALADNVQLGEGVMPKKGIYFAGMGATMYVSSLTINGYTGFTTTKLKEEYYERNAVFHIGETGEYIFKDSSYTTKVSKAEFLQAIKTMPVILSTPGYFQFVSPVMVGQMDDYCYAVIITGPSGATRTLYTAEYTAE